MSFFSSLGKALKSKTVWAGIGTAALGVGQIAAPYAPQILQFIPAGTPAGAAITIGLGALTIYGRIKAKQPLGPVIDATIAQTVDAVHQMNPGTEAPPASPGNVKAVTARVKPSL
jgi:hypothetical protein